MKPHHHVKVADHGGHCISTVLLKIDQLLVIMEKSQIKTAALRRIITECIVNVKIMFFYCVVQYVCLNFRIK